MAAEDSSAVGSFSDALLAVAAERMTDREARVLRRRLERNGPLTRIVARRVLKEYVDQGGDPTNVIAILQWLLDNWAAVYEIIKAILALFS